MSTSNYKISKEIKYKVSITDTKNQTKDYTLPGFPPIIQRIIQSPQDFQHGFKEITESNRNFIDVSSSYNTNECYFYSEKPFYIKVANSNVEGDYVIHHTSLFMYDNPNIGIKISIANGTLDYDPITQSLTSNESSTSQTIFYVNIDK